MSDERKLDAHLFICTNQREKGQCCAARGSIELRDRLKKEAKKRWGAKVRINASGCLGHCEEGIAAVLYPKGQWFVNLNEHSDDVLLAALSETLDKAKND